MMNARMNAEGYSALDVACAVRHAVAEIAAEFEREGHPGGWRNYDEVSFASIEEAKQYFESASLEVVIHDAGRALGIYLYGRQVEYKIFHKDASGIILVEEWAESWESWDSQAFQQELRRIASGHVQEADAVARAAKFLHVVESSTLLEAVRRELAALRHKNGY